MIGDGAGAGETAAVSVNGNNFDVGGFDWTGGFVLGATHRTAVVSLSAGQDLDILWAAANFGGNGVITGIQVSTSNVPEPSSMLLVAGMAMVSLTRRVRRKA